MFWSSRLTQIYAEGTYSHGFEFRIQQTSAGCDGERDGRGGKHLYGAAQNGRGSGSIKRFSKLVNIPKTSHLFKLQPDVQRSGRRRPQPGRNSLESRRWELAVCSIQSASWPLFNADVAAGCGRESQELWAGYGPMLADWWRLAPLPYRSVATGGRVWTGSRQGQG
jgi:hypothetical protein